MSDAKWSFNGSFWYSPWFPREGDTTGCTLEVITTKGGTNVITLESSTRSNETKRDSSDPTRGSSKD